MRATPHEHRLSFFFSICIKKRTRDEKGFYDYVQAVNNLNRTRARLCLLALAPHSLYAYILGPLLLILKGLMGALYNVCVAATATEREAGEAARGGDTWEGELRAKFRFKRGEVTLRGYAVDLYRGRSYTRSPILLYSLR